MTDWKNPFAKKLLGAAALLKAIDRDEDAQAHRLVAEFAETHGCKTLGELEANFHDASTALAALRQKKRKFTRWGQPKKTKGKRARA